MVYNGRNEAKAVNPMIEKLQVFESSSLDPYLNIAIEKHLLETVGAGNCILYLWQNQNTVVIGRNQNPWAECRTTLLEQEGGKLARRLSGGGAVFHDTGNLNFTFLMAQEDYDLDRQLQVIQTACSLAGIETERSGRNDILAQGSKFSGNAFYHAQGKAYHHGTLLVRADMDKLGRYLTPSKAKLEAKGVASVRSRVINLQTLCPTLTCEKLKGYMKEAFSRVYGLPAQILPSEIPDKVHESAAHFGSWDWLYGTKLQATFGCEDRFVWGGIHLELMVESGIIQAAQVFSDAMDWQLPSQVEKALTGCRFALEDIRIALQQLESDVYQDICNMLAAQAL